MSPSIQPIRGMNDVLPAEIGAWQHLDHVVQQVGEAVAHLADRSPENVHVLVQPAAKGRIAFGGKVAR